MSDRLASDPEAALAAAVRAALPAWLALHADRRARPEVADRQRRWAALVGADADDLFVRHSLLVAAARGVAAALGAALADDELAGALDWPAATRSGRALVEALHGRLAGVAWEAASRDVLRRLYESTIGAGARRGGGEYYTPDWLAQAVLAEAGEGRVLDPSCGSGTFLFHAVRRSLAADERAGVAPAEALARATARVRGVDVHPVAVVLARATYLLAIGRARLAGAAVRVPVVCADATAPEAGERADVLVGNPPWRAYRFMPAAMQAAFQRGSRAYGLWTGGRVSTHQDLAGLFAARVIDRYLAVGGRFAFVMPGAVLDRAQFAGLRGGRLGELCVAYAGAWDLRRVRPHVFPVGAAVLFGARAERPGPLAGREVWSGRVSRPDAGWDAVGPALARGSAGAAEATSRSAYHARFRQGAVLVPRVLALVECEGEGAEEVRVRSARSAHEKPPWRDLAGLAGRVEAAYVRPVVLGEHVLPFRARAAARGVVPQDGSSASAPGLAAWWRACEACWAAHRTSARLTLYEQFNYQQKLAQQLPVRPLRVVYTKSGMHLAAARLVDERAVVDHTLYWAAAGSPAEADYLCAVLNAGVVTRRVRPRMAYGKDERHIDKAVWQLPIPAFDAADPVHARLAALGRAAEAEVAGLTLARGCVAARREVRAFLAASATGRAIEALVEALLG